MKKLWLNVIGCLALLCCGLGFVGCDTTQTEIKALSIDKTPDILTYTVGQDLNLSGGTLRVTYMDDSVKIVPMTLATPNLTTFTTATNDQIIVLSYMGQTTKFGVSVQKGTLEPKFYNSTTTDESIPVISTKYTGDAVTFDKFLNTASLPTENIDTTYMYKMSNLDSAEYSSDAPINAGEYDVQISFTNSKNYNDLICYCKLNIARSDLKDLVLSGNSLDYNYKQIPNTYGSDIDLATYWTQSDGYLGRAPLPENIRAQLEYSYRPISDSAYNVISPNIITNEYNLNLNVGEYKVRVRISGNSNINDETIVEFDYTVTKRTLVRGEDYDLYISDGESETKLATDTTITFDNTKTYTLVLHSNVGELTLQSGTTYYIGNSTTAYTSINQSGSYTAVFSIVGNNNYQDVGRESITFVMQ